jgi:hypothetical protein
LWFHALEGRATGAEKWRLSIKGRSCAFGPNSYLVKREEYCVKEDKSLWGKELENVEIFLEFSEFGREYLRVWPNSYCVLRFWMGKRMNGETVKGGRENGGK